MQIFPHFEEFQQSVQQGDTNIALWCEMSADLLTPTLAYYKLQDLSPYNFLLESVEGGESVGRYSILCPHPSKIIYKESAGLVKIKDLVLDQEIELGANPFEEINKLLRQYQSQTALPYFSGGLAGYLSFEAIHYIEPDLEKSIATVEPCTSFPEVAFMLADTIVVFDHVLQKVVIVNHQFIQESFSPELAYQRGSLTIQTIFDLLQKPVQAPLLSFSDTKNQIEFLSNFTRESWKEALTKIKKYILEGDIFQTVLSQRFKAEINQLEPFKIYRTLRNINPSPYMYFLNFKDFQIVGSSPEAMVQCNNSGLASVRPIAGTRPRGQTPEEDNILTQDLLQDPKELAEHIMLVDLARNDLGKVCQYGSIHVPVKMIVEKYSHVMHIVSKVTGYLSDPYTALDLIKATFPAGTVSGAPKIRAIEIIYELEQSARGPYGGCIGFLGFCGDVNTAITIRTILLKKNQVFVQAGAGIVADSDPDKEFDETVNKAKALLETLCRTL